MRPVRARSSGAGGFRSPLLPGGQKKRGLGLTSERSEDLIVYFALTAILPAAAVVGFFLRRKAIRDGADLSSDDW